MLHQKRNLALLIAGNTVSTVGTSIYLIGLTLYVKGISNSGIQIAGVEIAALIPLILLGPVSGAFVDRWSKKRVIVLTDMSRGLLMFALSAIALFAATWGWSDGLRYISLLVVMFFAGILDSLFGPAINSLFPAVLEKDRLKSANALHASTGQLSGLIGQATGGLLYALLGAAVNLVSSMLFISLPFFVEEVLELPSAFYGYFLAVFIGGGICGYLLYGNLNTSQTTDRRFYAFASGFLGILIVLLAVVPLVPALFAIAFVCGMFNASVNLILNTYLQRKISESIRGRVFGGLGSFFTALTPLGYLIGGILIDVFSQDPRPIFLIVGVVIALIPLFMIRMRGYTGFFTDDIIDAQPGVVVVVQD